MAQLGSFINQYSGNSPDFKPEVGMGATHMGWTDRYPYTIVWVSASGKTVKVQEDIATRTDMNGMSESQTYDFKPDPTAPIKAVRLTKKGWVSAGQKFVLGKRDAYHDYSF